MLYQKPIMEILFFEVEDVVCTSGKYYYEGKTDGNYSNVSDDGLWC